MEKVKQLRLILRGRLVSERGFSLVEVLLASILFAIIVFALTSALIYGLESVRVAGSLSRATLLAEEGLEAARNIRDNDYSNLSVGTYGLLISGGKWIFSGSSDTTDGIFSRAITVSNLGTDRMQLSSTVTWQETTQRSGSVTVVSYLTNWRKSVIPAGDCNPYAISQGYNSGICRQNSAQCTRNSEIYLPGGDPECVTNYPGDPSRDTCCAVP